MKIEKQFEVNAPQQRIWEFITDPEKVGPCVPACTGVEPLGDGAYLAAVTLQVGPIKTTFNLTVSTTDERPPHYAAYHTQGEEGGKASRLSATSTLTVEPIDPHRSMVHYVSEITISGRLGKFGAGVMKKIADRDGERFVAALCREIEN